MARRRRFVLARVRPGRVSEQPFSRDEETLMASGAREQRAKLDPPRVTRSQAGVELGKGGRCLSVSFQLQLSLENACKKSGIVRLELAGLLEESQRLLRLVVEKVGQADTVKRDEVSRV